MVDQTEDKTSMEAIDQQVERSLSLVLHHDEVKQIAAAVKAVLNKRMRGNGTEEADDA